MAIRHVSEIEKEARRLVHNRQWLVNLAEVFALVIFPLSIGILTERMDELGNNFWYAILPLAAAQLPLSLVIIMAAKNEFYFFEYRDLEEKCAALIEKNKESHEESLQKDFSREAIYLATEATSNFVARFYPSSTPVTREDLADAIRDVLEITIDLRSEIFGYGGEAKHNIGVYLYSPSKMRLVPFFRDMDSRLTPHNREWKLGVGSVGACFVREKTMLSHDITKSEELSHDLSPGDEVAYRSMCSTPIFSLTNETAKGVFIVTSSEPNQFEKDIHQPFIENLASLLSIVIGLAYAKIPAEGDEYV